MKIVAHPQEELDVFVSDICERAHISKNTAVGLSGIGIACMYCHVSMPVTTAGERKKEKHVQSIVYFP